jgi:hypothetical protein
MRCRVICSGKFQGNKRAKGKSIAPDRGSVLFIVLIFIITVTTLVLISTLRMGSEADFLESEFSRLRAYTQCVSGLEFLKNRLSTGANNNIEFLDSNDRPLFPRLIVDGRDIYYRFTDIVKGKYARGKDFASVQDMDFILNLQDSSGLINFFRVDRALLKNLFAYHKIPPEKADIVIDSVWDWMDPDGFVRPAGAEADYYLKNDGYTPANRLIDNNDELLLVRGMDNDIYNKVGKLLDFSVINQGVNPNVMPAEAFHLFRGLGDENIQLIMEKREKKTFDGPAELTLISGYNFTLYPTALQFFTSNATYVTIKAKMDEKRFFYIKFRLDRIAGGGSMVESRPNDPFNTNKNHTDDFNHYFHLYHWQEGTELARIMETHE